MASETGGRAVLDAFFDEGVSTPLFGPDDGSVSVAFGLVGGQGAYAVCQDGGALAAADVERCCKALELAAQTGNPVVTFYDSKGAKLEEGLAGLAAAARLNAAAARLSGVVPQLAVVTGVCGASAAMAAANADLLVMSRQAELFLTPPFVSAAKGDALPGAGGAQAAQQAGVAALLADDAPDAARQAARLLALLPGNNLSEAADFAYAPPVAGLDGKAYTGRSAAAAVADEGSLVELYEGFGDGAAVFLGTVNGAVAGFVATNGPDTCLGRYCVAKTARFVRFCDAFSIPVVTLLNTGGLVKSSREDEAGNLRLAARLAGTYGDATTAKLAVVTGRAVGTAYTALGHADLTIAMEGAVVAPAEPSAVVSVLYNDEILASGQPVEAETAARTRRYEAEEAGAAAALRAGLADMVAQPETLRATVAAALDILATKRARRLPKKHGNMAL